MLYRCRTLTLLVLLTTAWVSRGGAENLREAPDCVPAAQSLQLATRIADQKGLVYFPAEEQLGKLLSIYRTFSPDPVDADAAVFFKPAYDINLMAGKVSANEWQLRFFSRECLTATVTLGQDAYDLLVAVLDPSATTGAMEQARAAKDAQSEPAGRGNIVGMELDKVPLPVQAYIFRVAVAAGVEFPWNIQLNEGLDPSAFAIAGSENSDLNNDGKTDYAVLLCQFAQSTPEFRTNGYPCAFGNLIISDSFKGYDYYDISGEVIDSFPGKRPLVEIVERSFGDCQHYYCSVIYRIELEDPLSSFQPFVELEKCELNKCSIAGHSANVSNQ